MFLSEDIDPVRVFLKMESFFDPKGIEIYHILRIFSVYYNVIELN